MCWNLSYFVLLLSNTEPAKYRIQDIFVGDAARNVTQLLKGTP